nr:MAG TPA: Helix-turn-helix XRE-family like protein [Caudoviricetes sp.]
MRTVNPSPLAKRRIALGLTQAQLAEKSHINIRQVQKIEKGESELGNITFATASRFAAALDLSIDQLAKYMV